MKKQLFIFCAALCSISALAQTLPAYLPTAGLVGWWPFNGNANDESGNGNNGTVNGAALTTDRYGSQNYAYNFDGISNHITLPPNSNQFIDSSYTISFWIYSLDTIDKNNGQEIISDRDNNSWSFKFRANFGIQNSGFQHHKIYLQTNTNSGYKEVLSPSPNINTWTNYIIAYNSNNLTLLGYKNGVLFDSLNNVTLPSSGNRQINIGRCVSPAFANGISYYNGKIDDIGFWNRALTDCEIQKLYNADNGLAISASSSTICSGQPVVLTASGATNYLWSTGAISSSIIINPNINTTYSVTTTYSANCVETKTVSVTVNQTPTVAVNSTTICSGTNATIIASGAASYSWDNGATTNSISVSPNANTNYTITGLTNGCSDTKTVSVTVNQTPTIAVSNGTICSGNSFTINPNGAATYSYSNGSAIVSPINTSTYTVTGSSFQNCTSVPQTLTVTVDANSTITSQPINQTLLAGTTAIFTVTATVGSVLQWQTNLGLGFQNLSNVSQYSGVNTATLTINNISISNDNQTFRCIAGTGLCSDTSDVATLSLSPVSITELMLFKNITIYPNPATRQVTIIADAKLSGTVFTVYNYTGKSVIEGKINSENTLIDLENLSEGIYLINIGENIKQTFKVIKQ